MSLTLCNLPFSASDIFELFLSPCDPCRSSKWWNRPSLGASSRDTWACEPCWRKKNNGVRGLSREGYTPPTEYAEVNEYGGNGVPGLYREDQATPTKYTEVNGKVTDTAKILTDPPPTHNTLPSLHVSAFLDYLIVWEGQRSSFQSFLALFYLLSSSPCLWALLGALSALRPFGRFVFYFYSLPLFLSLWEDVSSCCGSFAAGAVGEILLRWVSFLSFLSHTKLISLYLMSKWWL